jgi:uncharacterized protein
VSESNKIVVKALFTYPFKSCGGVRLERTTVLPHGFDQDRRFVVVDAVSGQFLESVYRQQLSLVQTLILDGSGEVCVHTPRMGLCSLHTVRRSGTPRPVTVQKTVITGYDQGDNIADWFSTCLGIRCRVVAIWETEMPKKEVADKIMTIAGHDSSTIHLINEASLSDLNRRIVYRSEKDDTHYNAVVAERFRPSIVIGGDKAYTEETWGDVQIGSTVLRFRKNAPRCYMTLINPLTGEIDDEPLRTLKKYKTNRKGEAEFGTYLFPIQSGEIKVGDVVSI